MWKSTWVGVLVTFAFGCGQSYQSALEVYTREVAELERLQKKQFVAEVALEAEIAKQKRVIASQRGSSYLAEADKKLIHSRVPPELRQASESLREEVERQKKMVESARAKRDALRGD